MFKALLMLVRVAGASCNLVAVSSDSRCCDHGFASSLSILSAKPYYSLIFFVMQRRGIGREARGCWEQNSVRWWRGYVAVFMEVSIFYRRIRSSR
jgi:hypothetical protein